MVILSAFFAFIGSAVRIFIDQSFFFVLIGQFFIGVGSCFIVNTVIQFCYNWFPPRDRPLFLAICSFMNTVGGGAGNIIPVFFVDEYSLEEKFRKDFYFYNVFMMFFTLAVFLLNLFFFRGNPPKHFGYLNSEEIVKTNKSNFFKQSFFMIKDLLSYKLFHIYLSIFLLCNSSITFLGSMFDLIVEDFGLSSTFGGIATLIIIFVGLGSSIFYSIFFMKYKNQKIFQYYYSTMT